MLIQCCKNALRSLNAASRYSVFNVFFEIAVNAVKFDALPRRCCSSLTSVFLVFHGLAFIARQAASSVVPVLKQVKNENYQLKT